MGVNTGSECGERETRGHQGIWRGCCQPLCCAAAYWRTLWRALCAATKHVCGEETGEGATQGVWTYYVGILGVRQTLRARVWGELHGMHLSGRTQGNPLSVEHCSFFCEQCLTFLEHCLSFLAHCSIFLPVEASEYRGTAPQESGSPPPARTFATGSSRHALEAMPPGLGLGLPQVTQ